jgi:hypothetical protein
MNIHAIEEIKPILEAVLIVGAIGFSALRRSGRKGQREMREPSAGRFWLSLIGAAICGAIAVGSFRYIQDHHGDYANYLMIFGALFGGLFGAGLLLKALIEGLRVAFSGGRR